MMPRGKDRAIERMQKWSAPELVAQMEIVRKESFSDIPWLNELLGDHASVTTSPCPSSAGGLSDTLGIFVLATPLLALSGIVVRIVPCIFRSSLRCLCGGAWSAPVRLSLLAQEPADGEV